MEILQEQNRNLYIFILNKNGFENLYLFKVRCPIFFALFSLTLRAIATNFRLT
jgi:hypothetical protein